MGLSEHYPLGPTNTGATTYWCLPLGLNAWLSSSEAQVARRLPHLLAARNCIEWETLETLKGRYPFPESARATGPGVTSGAIMWLARRSHPARLGARQRHQNSIFQKGTGAHPAEALAPLLPPPGTVIELRNWWEIAPGPSPAHSAAGTVCQTREDGYKSRLHLQTPRRLRVGPFFF